MKHKQKILPWVFILSGLFFGKKMSAQNDTVQYRITIDQELVRIAGEEKMGMTINGSIPGPTFRFTKGDYAMIHVTNEMDVETSIHWHGILLPNFFDGVPYLTTPPIEPGESFTYEFELIQAGTYWYHSHTRLQEQDGVFGSIVIEDPEEDQEYDSDLVLVVSDWTFEDPKDVLRTLKRGLEWYGIKKNTVAPLSRVISRGALGAQLNFWKQRMEGMDISDVYYPAFLTNGATSSNYPDFQPGERVRLRIINAAASTQFWLTFGGDRAPLLIAADGLDVVPVEREKTFIAIAETYDFIVEIPESGKLEIRATAQDGTGHTSAFIGSGETIHAPDDLPKPDLIAMMKEMAAMNMKMGAPALKFRPEKIEPYEMMRKYGMEMDHNSGATEHQMEAMEQADSLQPVDHGQHKMPQVDSLEHKGHKQQENPKDSLQLLDHMDHRQQMEEDSLQQPHKVHQMKQADSIGQMDHMKHIKKEDSLQQLHKMHQMEPGDSIRQMDQHQMEMEEARETSAERMPMEDMDAGHDMQDMNMFSQFNYDYLRAEEKTTFPEDKPVREILLNLTGNMDRYIWSINGVPLSEYDKIRIKQGEVARITLNNLTMMHHPMHLHGHFFRVLNEHGEYSPLKHTVNVAPMQKIVIEFNASEYGDWFFHCHILYHMEAGMARIFSYNTPRDERLEDYPLKILTNMSNHIFTWGEVGVASHMTDIELIATNIRNQFTLSGEYGWNENLEAEVTYERYLNDWFRLFGGVNIENEIEDNLDKVSTTAVAGIRYFTPYMFNLDLRMDHKLRPQISLSRELLIFRRVALFAEYEFQADFGWGNDLPEGEDFEKEEVFQIGLEYFLSKNFSLMGSYDNRFGAGGGLSARF